MGKWNYGSTTATSPLLAATSSTGGAAPAQLTYWDGHGNGEIIRLMMAVCGEKWEDKVALDDTGATHISNAAQFNKLREAGVLMSDQLPLLQIDGLNLVQKMAAVRYLARKHGLYGKDNAEADCLGTMPNWVKAHYSLMQNNETLSTYLKS